MTGRKLTMPTIAILATGEMAKTAPPPKPPTLQPPKSPYLGEPFGQWLRRRLSIFAWRRLIGKNGRRCS
jgi:hypothetical protein